MRHSPYIADYGTSTLRKVGLSYDLSLHFSYSTLVAIEIENRTFVTEEYRAYSDTTRRQVETLHNKVLVSKQLFEEIINICIPEPPPQIRDWLLERSRKAAVDTQS